VATLMLIRLCLLGGVLVFGLLSWVLRRTGSAVSSADPATLSALRALCFLFCAVALVAAVALRAVAARASSDAARIRLSIAGWASGESPALLGGVYLFMSGDARPYAIGVVVLLATFVIFPLRRPA
jgi:hypothetical protein